MLLVRAIKWFDCIAAPGQIGEIERLKGSKLSEKHWRNGRAGEVAADARVQYGFGHPQAILGSSGRPRLNCTFGNR
jgi:hypothetical protein